MYQFETSKISFLRSLFSNRHFIIFTNMDKNEIFSIGLMSGTSLDGIGFGVC